MSFASFLLGMIESGMAAHPPAPPPATAVQAAVTAGPSVLTAIEHVVMGQATADDALKIVNAILEGVAFVDPAAAPLVTLAIDLEPIAEVLIASGAVQPGSGANADPLGRGGRRS